MYELMDWYYCHKEILQTCSTLHRMLVTLCNANKISNRTVMCHDLRLELLTNITNKYDSFDVIAQIFVSITNYECNVAKMVWRDWMVLKI